MQNDDVANVAEPPAAARTPVASAGHELVDIGDGSPSP
jgi:hypothetical protein